MIKSKAVVFWILFLSFLGTNTALFANDTFIHIKVQDDITGFDLGPNGQYVTMTIRDETTEDRGHLLVQGLASKAASWTIPTQVGVIPFTPAFHPNGEDIAFAGYCHVPEGQCTEENSGWNLYVSNFRNGTTKQLTKPFDKLVRWRPKWSPSGELYFVGLSTNQTLGLGSLIANSAVFKVLPSGEISSVFPYDRRAEEGFVINPFGSLKAMYILAVREDELIIQTTLRVSDIRPGYRLKRYRDRGYDLDERLTKLVDRYVYTDNTPLKINRVHTIYSVRENEAIPIRDMDAFKRSFDYLSKPQNSAHVSGGSADQNSMQFYALGFEKGIGSKLVEFDGEKAQFGDPDFNQGFKSRLLYLRNSGLKTAFLVDHENDLNEKEVVVIDGDKNRQIIKINFQNE